jgi:hypothetical protein
MRLGKIVSLMPFLIGFIYKDNHTVALHLVRTRVFGSKVLVLAMNLIHPHGLPYKVFLKEGVFVNDSQAAKDFNLNESRWRVKAT